MTPRAEKLTHSATIYLALERAGRGIVTRAMTRDMLVRRAEELGFAFNETRSAVDNAIKHAEKASA